MLNKQHLTWTNGNARPIVKNVRPATGPIDTAFYLQVGKQLLVDKQACVVFVSRYLQQLIFLNIQLGDVQI